MEETSTDSLLHFLCPGCNAQLYFKPGTHQLNCNYCGTQVQIENATEPLKEFNLQAELSLTDTPAENIEQKAHKCTRCGSESIYSSDTPTFVCSFCNFEVVNPGAFRTRTIQPSAIIPFKIDKERVKTIFTKWAEEDWRIPSKINKLSLLQDMRGVYLPYWTFDAQAHSEWSGEAGRYYYETIEEEDADGNTVTHQEQRTEWISRKGTRQHFFEDILIKGSHKLSSREMDNISPYGLKGLVNFSDSYLSGFEAEPYDIPVNKAYSKAEEKMKWDMHGDCTDDCKIDTHRYLNVTTTYSKQTFKHILLPVWFCTYVYKNKTYNFRINGQTGKIDGIRTENDVTNREALLFLLGLILVIATVIYLLSLV